MRLPLLALVFVGVALAQPYFCPGSPKINDGETYNEGNFVKRCKATANGYAVSIVGCVTPGRSRVQLDTELQEGNLIYKCISTGNGGARTEVVSAGGSIPGGNKPAENLKCDGKYTNGQKFTDGNFVKLCSSSPLFTSTSIVACLTPSKKEVEVGSKATENGVTYNCIKTATGAKIETASGNSNGGPNPAADLLKCQGTYSNGQKFTEGNFVKQCVSTTTYAQTNIIACVSPGKKEIPLGSKITENGLIFSCVKTADGAKIQSEPESKENLKCQDKYSNGEKYFDGNFVKLCTSTSSYAATTVVACLTPTKKEIAVGGQIEEGRMIYKCTKTQTGVKIETELAKKGCQDGKYAVGQTFLSDNKRFVFKCLDEFGSADIIACKTDDGQDVNVGTEKVIDGFKYRCPQEGEGTVKYYKEYVGGETAPKQNKKGCGQYAIGQTILSTDGKFRFTCVSDNNIQFTSCIVEGGEVKADTKATIGVWTYDCKPTKNGGAAVTRQRASA